MTAYGEKKLLFHQDNTRKHKYVVAMAKLWGIASSFSPDLAPVTTFFLQIARRQKIKLPK